MILTKWNFEITVVLIYFWKRNLFFLSENVFEKVSKWNGSDIQVLEYKKNKFLFLFQTSRQFLSDLLRCPHWIVKFRKNFKPSRNGEISEMVWKDRWRSNRIHINHIPVLSPLPHVSYVVNKSEETSANRNKWETTGNEETQTGTKRSDLFRRSCINFDIFHLSAGFFGGWDEEGKRLTSRWRK